MGWKPRTGAAFGEFFGVSDLNGGPLMRQSLGFVSARDADEPRQDLVRPAHGLAALEDFPSHCRPPNSSAPFTFCGVLHSVFMAASPLLNTDPREV